MIEAIADLDYKAAMENYRQARMIIDRQMRNERLHYPYRVATNFQEFINKFGTQMTYQEIDDFVLTAKRIIERIDTLPEDRRTNRYVIDCKKAMQYVVEYCDELKSKKS